MPRKKTMSDLMGKTALEEKWKKEEEAKTPLEKAYEGGNKKDDPDFLNPEKIDESVKDQLPDQTGWRVLVLPFKSK